MSFTYSIYFCAINPFIRKLNQLSDPDQLRGAKLEDGRNLIPADISDAEIQQTSQAISDMKQAFNGFRENERKALLGIADPPPAPVPQEPEFGWAPWDFFPWLWTQVKKGATVSESY